jgi:hypothetical protein
MVYRMYIETGECNISDMQEFLNDAIHTENVLRRKKNQIEIEINCIEVAVWKMKF